MSQCRFQWASFGSWRIQHHCGLGEGHGDRHRCDEHPGSYVAVGAESLVMGGWEDPIPPDIRAELDCTPAWWEAQFRALERKLIPRDPSAHVGHDVEYGDEISLVLASGERVAYSADGGWCVTCGVSIDRA